MNKTLKKYTEEIEKLKERIGDKEIATEIVYLSRIQGISKRLLLARYKNIVTLFNSLGFKNHEVLDYIRTNKRILEQDISIIYENYRFIASIFVKNNKTRSDLKNYISSTYNGKNILTTPKGNIINMINFINKVFKANGKTEKESYEYLYNNRNILMENVDSLISKLFVLSKVGLDKKLIFDEPMYIYSDLSCESLNNAINCLKEKNKELSIEKIYSYAYGVIDNEEDIKYTLNNDEITKDAFNYNMKLTRKSNVEL